jgi:serralysin
MYPARSAEPREATTVPRRSTILAVGVLVGLPAALPLAPAAAATGSTVSTGGPGTNVTFTGGDEANALHVTDRVVGEFRRIYTFDDVVPLTPGTGCTHPDADDTTLVECSVSDQPTSENNLVVRMGGGEDSAFIDDVYAMTSLYGGAGTDRLRGTDVDRMYGEAGSDVLSSSGSTDGGPGDDTISGPGFVRGGDGNDRIRGTDGGDTIEGGRGNDTILAAGGRDLVHGNSGRDDIRGGTHDDRLYGGPDADLVYGNSGNDLVVGGPGRDTVSGGPGRNTVRQ